MWQSEMHQFLRLYIFFDYNYMCVHIMRHTIQTNILRRQNFAVFNVALSRHHQKVI